MKHAVVILHYCEEQLTETCINSVYENVSIDDDVHIVVGDNASQNDSYIYLKERYRECKNIYFLHNDENYGFAKGNNVGFFFAKSKWMCTYIFTYLHR